MDISGKCKTVAWFAKYQKHPSLGCYDGTIWRIIRIENHIHFYLVGHYQLLFKSFIGTQMGDVKKVLKKVALCDIMPFLPMASKGSGRGNWGN